MLLPRMKPMGPKMWSMSPLPAALILLVSCYRV